MSIIPLILGGFLVALALAHAFFKIFVAYGHCSGGAPLLDGYIFPPVFLGVGSAIFFRTFQIESSGFVVAIATFVVLFAAYEIAWRLGARRRR
jgi:hypothetical protein